MEDPSRSVSIAHAASSTDTNYEIADAGNVAVTVNDDDPTTVTLASTTGNSNIAERSSKTFTVTLGRGLVNGESLPVPLSFGSVGNGVAGATSGTDYTVTGGTATGVTHSNVLDGGVYTVTFTGLESGATATTATLTLSAAINGDAEESDENVFIAINVHVLNTSSGTGLNGGASGSSSVSFFITEDTTAPTVDISGLSGTSGAVTVTITFSEAVTGFTVDDIMLTNGVASDFTGSGTTYTATITLTDDSMVTSLVIASDVATDAANNGNKRASANNATVARLQAPAPLTATPDDGQVTLSWTVTADNTGFAAATKYRYQYLEPGVGFTDWRDVLDNDGDLSDETSHVVTSLTNDVNHLFQVRAVNGAGNAASTTAMPSATSDSTAPMVTSIVRQTPSTSLTDADSLTWRVTFSESVTGVDGADFTVTGSTATAAAADSSAGVVWDVTASGGDLESLEGAVTLGFASGQDIVDASGNALDPTLPAGAETAYTVDNTPDRPTGADRTVTTKEDTAYAFTADDFGFVDADEGDTLAGIRITALETAGALKFSADVTLDQVISKAQIDTGLLTFTPAANANGPGYATFGFKVSDGALESAAANTITISVTPVNDAPTGKSTIAEFSGVLSQGDTLTAGTDAINDVDNLGTFSYQWKRGGTAITGATSSTYTPVQADVGSTITVTVSWTDGDGTVESVTSDPTRTLTNINDAPTVVTMIGDQSATEAEVFGFTVPAGTFTDSDGDDLSYTATQADTDSTPLPE